MIQIAKITKVTVTTDDFRMFTGYYKDNHSLRSPCLVQVGEYDEAVYFRGYKDFEKDECKEAIAILVNELSKPRTMTLERFNTSSPNEVTYE
jgi:hypothetical protein